jgi:hypothetical protein
MKPTVCFRNPPPRRRSAGLAAALAGFAVLSGASPAARAAISIVETAEFSLSPFNPTMISEPLGPGDNFITGALPGESTIPDVDVLQLGNPLSLPLAITISFFNFVPSAPPHPATVRLMAPNSGQVTADGNGLFVLSAVLSDPATLVFYMSGPGVGGSEFILAGSANYTVTISAVPEPSGAALLLLASAVYFRRSRGITRSPAVETARA